jgi:Ca2+-binding EF-hand superfamily protein
MFLDYDANGSGTIDIYEIRKILHHMDMDMSKENAQELMDLIDVDGSGEIDFDEYCGYVLLSTNILSNKRPKYMN